MNHNATPRFAVIGNPVAHSRSPTIHRMFGAQTGITLDYDRIAAPVDQFEQIVSTFFAEGGRGLNVTVPFKLDAWQLAREHLSVRAQQAQAVNTLWMEDGSLHGCNTDGPGLVDDLLRLGIIAPQTDILVVGAGGATRGVIGPLLLAGARRLHIVNRTRHKAVELLDWWLRQDPALQNRLSAGGLSEAARAGGWNLVINASASSLADAAPDLPGSLYAPGALAYDMMYSAEPTPFMRQAAADGAQRTADGLGMLVAQAAVSFAIWHGVKPATEPVLQAIRAELDASLRPPAKA
jgi:shikimate dehydrogenase